MGSKSLFLYNHIKILGFKKLKGSFNMKIAVIQGPNINMLGIREQNIYGPMSMDQIHEQITNAAKQNGVEVEFFQSNLE